MLIKSSRYGGKMVYHFTDKANFESIGQKGLVSKARMRMEKWWPAKVGGNDISHKADTANGIDPYVSLCMTRDHPMRFLAQRDNRLTEPHYLAIDPDVLKLDGVLISLGIANANGAEKLPVKDAIPLLDLDVLYNFTDWKKPEVQDRKRVANKYEILVPDNVPVNLIKGYY
ncbi:hypothetical protein TH15_06120 [Thalassospira profundimaris]|uniref:DUF4433 domain-containing protein n=2 Tax=Thalassospira indica TaxID=1891279 RepID=A0ABM6Y3U5_9PROT|nr:DUF4433 domain-containing protein [Thalassospira indica]AXO16622.1 DUF4433 domain-containing protein [Thalassospira indica]OAZ15344.1 hypothetical protein TH15_06120 [Thalassospira profundimaris]